MKKYFEADVPEGSKLFSYPTFRNDEDVNFSVPIEEIPAPVYLDREKVEAILFELTDLLMP